MTVAVDDRFTSIMVYYRMILLLHSHGRHKMAMAMRSQKGDSNDSFDSLPSLMTLFVCCHRHPTNRGVDMSMNVHMKNIKFTVKGKPPVSMDHLTIRGNNVRWGNLEQNMVERHGNDSIVSLMLV